MLLVIQGPTDAQLNHFLVVISLTHAHTHAAVAVFTLSLIWAGVSTATAVMLVRTRKKTKPDRRAPAQKYTQDKVQKPCGLNRLLGFVFSMLGGALSFLHAGLFTLFFCRQ